jgi:glycosyltransferase involved in cell wall biosynthesis/predicted metal-dependent phosphoesterase TrpH
MNDKRKNGTPVEASAGVTRADLHCHSTASEVSKLRTARSLALPECATPPEEVYALAKRRGMDFVTITDHDTIEGALALADLPDTFVSEELTAWFKGQPQAVHVLCYGITADDHEWLQAHSDDLEACAGYLHEHGIACALAHPFFHVAAPLTAAHRRELAQLFPVWETRNGARAPELNAPAAIYIETHGGVAVAGSDDHAGVDIGRTWTEAPGAATSEDFLAHLRAGRVSAHGKQGSAAKWAHSAMALAARSLAEPAVNGDRAAVPDARAALRLAERIVLDGEFRGGSGVLDDGTPALGRQEAASLLHAWLAQLELESGTGGLIGRMQADDFSHSALERRARRVHEHRLRAAAGELAGAAGPEAIAPAAQRLLGACLPALPYVPAAAFLAREQRRLAERDGEPSRVAVIADGIGAVHGVANALQQLRDRGVPGYEVEVLGTDARVDRRLSAVAELELPVYPGLQLGVPSVFALAQELTERRYDLVHVSAPGPAGLAAVAIARVMGLPVVGSYHTELQAYARARTGDAGLEDIVRRAVAAFYGACRVVLCPSASAAASVQALGIAPTAVCRWDRGVDLERFNPARYAPGLLPDGGFNVLYAGRLSREKGVELLAESFLVARDRDPRLHLVLAGRGPEEDLLRRRLGSAATFLGWVAPDALARAYASADLFLFTSVTDTFGQVILEAQASGLPVLAVAAGGPAELIDDGRSGCLVPPDPVAIATALSTLSRRASIRDRLATGGLLAARERSWERSLRQLAEGYDRALGRDAPAVAQAIRAA